MIRKILSFGTIEAVARGLNWLLLMVLPFLLSATEYGIVGLIVAAEGLVVTVALLGQDRSILRFFTDADYDQSDLIGSVIWILVAGATVVFVAVGILQAVGTDSVGGIPIVPHTWLLALLVAGSLLLRYHWAYARVADEAGHFLVSRVGVAIAKLVAVVGLALVWRSSVSYAAGASAAIIVVGVASTIRWPIQRLRASRPVVRRLLQFGWPFVFHAVSGNLLMAADRFMIEAFMDEASVGIYTFAYSVGASLSFVFGSLIVYVEPQIYKAADDPKRATRWLDIFLGTCAIGGIVVGMLLIAVAGPAALKFLAPEYGLATSLIPIVVGAHVITPIYLASSYQLTNQKQTMLIAVSSGSSAILNIVLNLVLIPEYGVMGAAIATFASYLFLAVIITFLSSRSMRPGRTGLTMMGLVLLAGGSMSVAGHPLITYGVPTAVTLILMRQVYSLYHRR